MESQQTFHWQQAAAVLGGLCGIGTFRREPEGRSFVAPGIRITPPLVLDVPAAVTDLEAFVSLLEAGHGPGRQLVVLLQAGAASIGYFTGGEALATKSIKKYVVRGRGKAQPTYLESKGKSRYGSRLRLQNARELLVETNERLCEWVEQLGPPDAVFYSCPKRSWPELFRARTAPPFPREAAIRIPLDVPVPTTETLLLTYRRMSYGRIEREGEGEDGGEGGGRGGE